MDDEPAAGLGVVAAVAVGLPGDFDELRVAAAGGFAGELDAERAATGRREAERAVADRAGAMPSNTCPIRWKRKRMQCSCTVFAISASWDCSRECFP